MTYDHEVTLIGHEYGEPDALGQQRPVPVETVILCAEKSVRASEFYAAGQSGLRPEIVLIVHRFEYDGQVEVEYRGRRLRVLRTYAIGLDEIELVCGGRAGD
jgi:SPP1 family predicted phage head-tail adaptor